MTAPRPADTPADDGPKPGRGAGAWWKLLAGGAVTAVFAWLLVRRMDAEEVGRAFAALSLPAVLGALALLAAGYALRVVRWWRMLRVLEPDLPCAPCIWPLLTGVAVNNVLPLRAGDALRVFGFRRQLRSPAMRVAGTLVIERLLDVAVLSAFLFLGLLAAPEGAIPPAFAAAPWLAGSGTGALLALVLFPRLLDRLLDLLRARLADRGGWAEAVAKQAERLIEALGLLRSPPRLLALLALSAAAWACEGAVFAMVAAAVGIDAAPLAPWLSLATGTLATVLPSAPGYLGTFDWFAAQGMAAYGVPLETADAFALTVHAILWAPLTACGLLYAAARGARLAGRDRRAVSDRAAR